MNLITILFSIIMISQSVYATNKILNKNTSKVICTEMDGTKLTVAEVEDAVSAYIEDLDGEAEPTDYATEYDLLVDELCVD